MTIEGELVVRLAWNDGRVHDVEIRSSRPLVVPKVLEGRSVDEAAAIVPRLYSICAGAQGAAAAGALGRAAGRTASLRGAARAIVGEAIQEQLRRLLIDLPSLLGLDPEVAPVAAARQALAPLLASRAIAGPGVAASGDRLAELCEQHVTGMSIEGWLRLASADDVRQWASGAKSIPARLVRRWLGDDPGLGASEVAPMPRADRDAIEANILCPLARDPSFAAAPHWHGVPVETGPWARSIDHPLVEDCTQAFGNSVVTRTVARLTDLARDIQRLAGDADDVIDAWSPAPGRGACAVATARGLLVHAAEVTDGRVARYAIVAPTEWNFHPRGALAQALAALVDVDAESLRHRAAQVAQVLDPCVACRVEIGHA